MKYLIWFFLFWLFLYILLGFHSTTRYTNNTNTTVARALTINDYIKKYSSEYKVSEKLIRDVLKRESKTRCNPPLGDSGLARGPAQFHKGTFEMFAKQKGEKLDYYSCHDQIKLMVWAFSKGEKYRWHWSAYRAIVNKS